MRHCLAIEGVTPHSSINNPTSLWLGVSQIQRSTPQSKQSLDGLNRSQGLIKRRNTNAWGKNLSFGHGILERIFHVPAVLSLTCLVIGARRSFELKFAENLLVCLVVLGILT